MNFGASREAEPRAPAAQKKKEALMFTIKHVTHEGRERIIEADEFRVEPMGVGHTQFSAWSLGDGPDDMSFWHGDPTIHGGPDSETIYVMNRFGSTVATHRFVTLQLGASGAVYPPALAEPAVIAG